MKRRVGQRKRTSQDATENPDEELLYDFGQAEDELTIETSGPDNAGSPSSKRAKLPPHKVRKLLHKASLYQPPTHQELNSLKETENLFHSSLFRMQTSELLSEVMIKEKLRKRIDSFLHSFKDVLMALPKQKEHDVTDQKWVSKKNLKVPFNQTPYAVKGKFRFLPPTSVKVVGSYMLGTSVRPDTHIDLVLQVPEECLQAKDYLNQRYLRKRALYLTKLAILLEGKDLIDDLAFTYHHGNHLKPILVVTPHGKFSGRVKVHVHTWIDSGHFKLSRFHVDKNNVRPAWYQMSAGTDKTPADDLAPATPHYNMAVLADMLSAHHLEVAHTALADAGGIRHGIVLLKVWLHQRQLNKGYGCFSNFIMTMLVVHLLAQRKLTNIMSSYQVVRNTLLAISQTDLTTNGISMAPTTTEDNSAPSLADFHRHFEVVFVDPSGYLNLCASMTASTFKNVQHECKLSLQFFETPGLDGFEALFMKPVPFLLKFDQVFHISDVEDLSSSPLCQDDEVLDQGGYHAPGLSRKLLNLLEKALTTRTKLIALDLQPPQQWSVSEEPPTPSVASRFTVGVLLDAEAAASAVDRGPPADSEEAGAFRDLWREKAELRRFQSGDICEAVVWKCNSVADRRHIICSIVKHILKTHAGIAWEHVKYVGRQLDPLLTIPSLSGSNVDYFTGEEQQQALSHSFEQLAKQLRGLHDLPLAIHSVQATAPALRGADVFPPLPATAPSTAAIDDQRYIPAGRKMQCPPYTPAQTVMCILESSGKWPEEPDAVRRLKAAFHAQLAEQLTAHYSLPAEAYPNHLIVFKDGYVFRIQVGYLREVNLLKKVRTPNGMLQITDTKAAAQLERQLLVLPKVASALNGLQQHHLSYSAAVRLARRWTCSQLLGDHLSQEATELLMAHVYLQPAPFTAPSSPMVAFLRWLYLVAYHDWEKEPLIVNLNNELTRTNFADIHSAFSNDRQASPPMFVMTPYDPVKQRSLWTMEQPSTQLLKRLVLVARQSVVTLREQLTDNQFKLDYKVIFRPPLEAYDMLIHLKQRQVPCAYLAVDTLTSALTPRYVPMQETPDHTRRIMPVVDFDPVQSYLKELRAAFDDLAIFFYNPLGGSYIAVLWKQPALLPKPFKVNTVAVMKPNLDQTAVKVAMSPNIDAVLADISILGADLVKNIEILRSVQ